MNLRNHTTLCPAAMAAMAALLLAPPASALTDHLTVVTTHPHTGASATLELDLYSLRASNWESRIYSSPTNYTVLPANQVPEARGGALSPRAQTMRGESLMPRTV